MDWDEERVRRIVRRVVSRKMPLFRRYPEWGEEDLLLEGMEFARRAHEEYDPERSAYSTWVYRAAACRIIDVWRKRDRHNVHETAAVQLKPGYVMPPELAEPGAIGLADADTVEWIRNVHTLIRLRLSRFGPAPRRGGRGRPPLYEVSQILTLHALKRERGLSYRGLTLYLAQRPDVCAAIGLSTVPDHSNYFLREKSVLKIGFGRAATNNGAS